MGYDGEFESIMFGKYEVTVVLLESRGLKGTVTS